MVAASRNRSETRERILVAAFELFAQQGFEATTISAIERRVGLAVGTGSLNHHFKTKDELLRACVEHEVTLRMNEVAAERADLAWPDGEHEQAVFAARLVLADMRRFDQLRRLLATEGERIPDLRRTVTQRLDGSGALGGWLDDPSRIVAVAALSGYHQMEQYQDERIASVAERDFIEALLALLPPGRPPGIAVEQWAALRAADPTPKRRRR